MFVVQSPSTGSFQHYGVKGMKWGVRHDRKTALKGSRTAERDENYSRVDLSKKKALKSVPYGKTLDDHFSRQKGTSNPETRGRFFPSEHGKYRTDGRHKDTEFATRTGSGGSGQIIRPGYNTAGEKEFEDLTTQSRRRDEQWKQRGKYQKEAPGPDSDTKKSLTNSATVQNLVRKGKEAVDKIVKAAKKTIKNVSKTAKKTVEKGVKAVSNFFKNAVKRSPGKVERISAGGYAIISVEPSRKSYKRK